MCMSIFFDRFRKSHRCTPSCAGDRRRIWMACLMGVAFSTSRLPPGGIALGAVPRSLESLFPVQYLAATTGRIGGILSSFFPFTLSARLFQTLINPEPNEACGGGSAEPLSPSLPLNPALLSGSCGELPPNCRAPPSLFLSHHLESLSAFLVDRNYFLLTVPGAFLPALPVIFLCKPRGHFCSGIFSFQVSLCPGEANLLCSYHLGVSFHF